MRDWPYGWPCYLAAKGGGHSLSAPCVRLFPVEDQHLPREGRSARGKQRVIRNRAPDGRVGLGPGGAGLGDERWLDHRFSRGRAGRRPQEAAGGSGRQGLLSERWRTHGSAREAWEEAQEGTEVRREKHRGRGEPGEGRRGGSTGRVEQRATRDAGGSVEAVDGGSMPPRWWQIWCLMWPNYGKREGKHGELRSGY